MATPDHTLQPDAYDAYKAKEGLDHARRAAQFAAIAEANPDLREIAAGRAAAEAEAASNSFRNPDGSPNPKALALAAQASHDKDPAAFLKALDDVGQNRDRNGEALKELSRHTGQASSNDMRAVRTALLKDEQEAAHSGDDAKAQALLRQAQYAEKTANEIDARHGGQQADAPAPRDVAAHHSTGQSETRTARARPSTPAKAADSTGSSEVPGVKELQGIVGGVVGAIEGAAKGGGGGNSLLPSGERASIEASETGRGNEIRGLSPDALARAAGMGENDGFVVPSGKGGLASIEGLAEAARGALKQGVELGREHSGEAASLTAALERLSPDLSRAINDTLGHASGVDIPTSGAKPRSADIPIPS